MSTESLHSPTASEFAPLRLFRAAVHRLEAFPLEPVQILGRVAIAKLFWDSAQSKLASWPVTVQLFANEYRVPLLPADVAAALGTTVELGGAVAIAFGLFSRLAALALLGLVAVIQLFVYPQSWGQHVFWASLLILIVLRGPGRLSLDHLITRLSKRQD
jgi:putative oxidoreductase